MLDTHIPKGNRHATITVIAIGFLLLGIYHSMWATCLSELKREFDLSESELGLRITFGALIAIPLGFTMGALLYRYGRKVFPAALVILATNLVALSLLDNLDNVDHKTLLFAPFIAAACGFGIYNTSINTSALHVEHETNKHYMPNLHALFSVGGIVGSLLAGILLTTNLSVGNIYLLMAFGLVSVGGFLTTMTTAHARPKGAEHKKHIFDREVINNQSVRRFLPISMLISLGEVALYVWPVIYLRDELHAPAFVGASALLALFTAMAIGRFATTSLQSRYGRMTSMQFAGLIIAIGMTIALVTEVIPVVIVGVLIAGLGYSVCYPTSMSIAGALVPGNASGVSAFVQPMKGVAAMASPVVFGTLADFSSLRLALCLEVLIGLFAAVGIWRYRNSPQCTQIN